MKLFITLALSCLFFSHSYSQWIEVEGVEGSVQVSDMVEYQQYLFAGTQCGLYVKHLNSSEWERLDYYFVRHLSINGDTLIESVSSGIIYRDLTSTTFDTLSAVFDPYLYSAAATVQVNNITYAPSSSGVIAIKNSGDSVFYFNDGFPLSYYVEPSGDSIPLCDVFRLFRNNKTLYAFSDSTLYRRNVDSAKWQVVSTSQAIFVPLHAAASSQAFFSLTRDSLYRSLDTGKTWKGIYPNNLTPNWLGDFTVVNNVLYMLDDNQRVMQSVDQGFTWLPASTGLQQVPFNLASTQNSLYASTERGLEKYQAGLWFVENSKGMACTQGVTGIINNSFGLFMSQYLGIYKYMGSNGWQNVSPNDTVINVYGPLYTAGNSLVVASYQSSSSFNPTVDSAIVNVSVDGGQTWQRYGWPFGRVRDIHFLHQGATLYALAGGDLFESSDMGASWSALGPQLLGLRASENNELVIYDGKYWSPDPWNGEIESFDLTTGRTKVWQFYNISPNDGYFDLVFSKDTLLFSHNGTKTYYKGKNSQWQAFANPPLYLEDTENFANQIFAYGREGFISQSKTGLQPWQVVTDTLPQGVWPSGALAIYQDTFFVSTLTNIFKHPVPDSLLLNLAEIAQTKQYDLYPNPANSSLTLNGPAGGPLLLEIHTAEGRLCFRAAVQTKQRINLPELPAGLYWVRLTGDDGLRETHRLIIKD